VNPASLIYHLDGRKPNKEKILTTTDVARSWPQRGGLCHILWSPHCGHLPHHGSRPIVFPHPSCNQISFEVPPVKNDMAINGVALT